MKRYVRILFVILMVLLDVFVLFSTVSLADFTISDAAGWTGSADANVTTTTKNIMTGLVTIIRIVGYGISIIMLIYVGIKYMSAAPQEKAEFKKSATGFVVGAIALFATTSIITIIANFATDNINK